MIRHGQSQANVAGHLCGAFDSPLSRLGFEQAENLGKSLKSKSIKFDICFTSPLQRAVETAAFLHPKEGLNTDARLMEGSVGSAAFENLGEFRKMNPEFCFHGFNPTVRYPGGESLQEFDARVGAFVREKIVPRVGSCRKVGVVAHNGTLGLIFRHLIGTDLSNFPFLEVENCGVMLFDLQSFRGKIRVLQQCCTLS